MNNQKSLQEILDELVDWCYKETGSKAEITVYLPQQACELFNAYLYQRSGLITPSHGSFREQQLYSTNGTVIVKPQENV